MIEDHDHHLWRDGVGVIVCVDNDSVFVHRTLQSDGVRTENVVMLMLVGCHIQHLPEIASIGSTERFLITRLYHQQRLESA